MDQHMDGYQEIEVYCTVLHLICNYINDEACQWFMKSGGVPMNGHTFPSSNFKHLNLLFVMARPALYQKYDICMFIPAADCHSSLVTA